MLWFVDELVDTIEIKLPLSSLDEMKAWIKKRGRHLTEDSTNAVDISYSMIESRLTNFLHLGFHEHGVVQHDTKIACICE